MTPPLSAKRAITAISVCIVLSVVASLIDRVTGRMSVGEFSFNIIIYGVLVMIPYKLYRRSNATRFVFAVLVAVGILLWLGSPTPPLPLFSKISAIVQIPIIAVTFYWLFFTDNASEWFNGLAKNIAEDSASERIEPKL